MRAWLAFMVMGAALGCATRNAVEEPVAVAPESAPAVVDVQPSPPSLEMAEAPVVVTCPGVDMDLPRALPVPASAGPDAECQAFPRKLTRRIEKAARKHWTLTNPRSKLEVSFGCDTLGKDLDELIFESSGGHSFSLDLYRIRPRGTGSYEVTWLRYGAYGTHAPYDSPDPWALAATDGAKVQTAIIAADRMEPALLQLRAAMQLQLREIEPPLSRDGWNTVRLSSSSVDFHTAYRFVDTAGLGKQDFWAGYQGSGEQERWVPMAIAERLFLDTLRADDIESMYVEREPTDDDRDFFAERFATARDRGDDFGKWYIRERMLGMARTLGDARLTPELLNVLTLSGEYSDARSRAIAVDVLTGLLGHEDVRRDSDGAARSVADAAMQMREQCGLSAAP